MKNNATQRALERLHRFSDKDVTLGLRTYDSDALRTLVSNGPVRLKQLKSELQRESLRQVIRCAEKILKDRVCIAS